MEKILKGFVSLAVAVVCSAYAFGQDASATIFVSYRASLNDAYDGGVKVTMRECYAMVWTKPGMTFAGFNADGTVKGDESDLFAVAQLMPGESCLFGISSDEYAMRTQGKWSLAVYLLDTRGVNGVPMGLDENGRLIRVNHWGLAVEAVAAFTATDAITPILSVLGGAETDSELSTDNSSEPLEITGFEIEGDEAVITTKGGSKCCTFAVEKANSVSESFSGEVDPQDGNGVNVFRVPLSRFQKGGCFRMKRSSVIKAK